MFTVGNVVVLTLVLIIFFIVRRFDNKRINTDVVKRRFSDTVAQFNEIVAEQQEELKGLRLAVASEQKTAVSLLERSRKLNQSVGEQEPKVSELRTRMDEFNKLLPQLMAMTELAQKNIDSVQQESEYVDGVGKKIKAAQELLATLEERFEHAHTNFEQTNQKQLHEVEARVLAVSETRGQQLLESVTDSVDHANTILEDVSGTIQSIEEKELALREFADGVVAKSADTIDDLIEKNIASANSSINEKAKQMLATKIADLDTVEQRFSERISAVTEMTQVWDGKLIESRKAFESLEHSVQKQLDRVDESLTGFQDRLAVMESDKEKAFVQSVQNLQLQYGTLVSETKDELQSIEDDTVQRIYDSARSAEESITNTYNTIDTDTKEIESRCATVLDEARERLNHLGDRVSSLEDAAIRALQAHFNTQVDAVQKGNKTVVAELQSLVEQIRTEKTELQNTTEAELQTLRTAFTSGQEATRLELMENLERVFADTVKQSQSKFSESFQNFTKGVEEQEALIEEKLGALQNDMVEARADLNSWKTQLEKGFQELQNGANDTEIAVAKQNDAIQTQFAGIALRMQQITKDAGNLAEILTENQNELLSASKKELDKQFLTLTESFDEKFRRAEQTLIEHLKSDVESLEEEFQFRLKRLETVPDQITVFEGQLRDSVQSTYDSLTGELEKQRSQFETKRSELFATLKQLHGKVSDSLKEQGNVLDSGSAALQDRFTSMMHDFDAKLRGVDSRYNALLNKNEQDVAERIGEQGNKLHAAIFENMQGIENSLKQETRLAYQDARSETFRMVQEFMQELQELRTRGEALLSDSNEFSESQKGQFRESAELLRKEFKDMLEQEYSSQHNEWKKDFDLQFKRITDYLVETEQSYLEQYSKLQSDLLQLEQQLGNQSLQFAKDQSEFFDAFDTKKASYSEELTTLMQSTRDQFVDIRTRLLEQFTMKSSVLEQQLEKLEKKHNGFVDQAKLFDRIENNTTELKKISLDVQNDIDNLRQERKWIHELEVRIQKTKKNARDAEQQLVKFLGEKRRIDQLEKDFTTLMQRSHAVELKMQDVIAREDDIDKIQLMLRHLNGIEAEVEERNKRLLEKKELIDATIDGVQSGFTQLEGLEKQLEQYGEKLVVVPSQIHDMQSELEQIESRQAALQELAERANTIDEVLQDSEERTQKLEKAREWLAREETRYGELNRSIQDQLQSLNQLVQADLTDIHKEAGAPGKNSRKTVIQLSKQGWNADEISRVTKLSKGEVELILEMATETIP